MFNCAEDVLRHHDDCVTLSSGERDEMRNRRNTNRERVKSGLKRAERPSPLEFKSQGSYAMKTMVQHPKKNFDVDDGIYFSRESMVKPSGAEMSALEVRQMIRDAVDDGSFKQAPEVRKNCVRVYYEQGYHVDLPSYRRTVSAGKGPEGTDVVTHELASVDWKSSDARDVTAWYEEENKRLSKDDGNGTQLRRVTRNIKRFAKSRSSWEPLVLSGFGITKLVTECFRGAESRDDVALHDTMLAIRDRLRGNLVVHHPVTAGDTITDGPADPKSIYLRDRLTDAVDWLAPTHRPSCTRTEALACWDKVFNTTYFSDRGGAPGSGSSRPSDVTTAGLIREIGSSARAREAVRKDGGGRYA